MSDEPRDLRKLIAEVRAARDGRPGWRLTWLRENRREETDERVSIDLEGADITELVDALADALEEVLEVVEESDPYLIDEREWYRRNAMTGARGCEEKMARLDALITRARRLLGRKP
jgi:hypothetical protein